MDHTFTPSFANPLQCAKCRYGVIEHTNMATCECCPNVGEMSLFNNMLMCPACIEKEQALVKTPPAPPQESIETFKEKVERVRQEHIEQGILKPTGILNINNLVDKARDVDYSIQVRTDLFNAATIAAHEVFKSIDENPEITNKQFAKAEFITERQKHFQKVVFDANQTVIEAQNNLRVLQSELNKIVNTLRQEERDKLKLANPEYKPGAVKSPKDSAKPRPPKKPKFDKKELIDETAKLLGEGLPATLAGIQSICTSKDMTPKQAANHFRKMLGAPVQ